MFLIQNIIEIIKLKFILYILLSFDKSKVYTEKKYVKQKTMGVKYDHSRTNSV